MSILIIFRNMRSYSFTRFPIRQFSQDGIPARFLSSYTKTNNDDPIERIKKAPDRDPCAYL